jgi:hypothetical protein
MRPPGQSVLQGLGFQGLLPPLHDCLQDSQEETVKEAGGWLGHGVQAM